MALPINDDFANGELSVEELEAIAAGWPGWVHSAAHWVHDLGHAFAAIGESATKWPLGPPVAAFDAAIVAAILLA